VKATIIIMAGIIITTMTTMAVNFLPLKSNHYENENLNGGYNSEPCAGR
jgi:hypothetical protein